MRTEAEPLPRAVTRCEKAERLRHAAGRTMVMKRRRLEMVRRCCRLEVAAMQWRY